MGIYKVLENKFIFNLGQAIMAPRVVRNIRKKLFEALIFGETRDYRVLELGCGTGHFSVQKNNVEYIGPRTTVLSRYL